MKEQLINLEIRMAHQEQAIQELSDTVYAQHKSIEQLTVLCRHLSDKLRGVTDQPAPVDSGDEIPPHY